VPREFQESDVLLAHVIQDTHRAQIPMGEPKDIPPRPSQFALQGLYSLTGSENAAQKAVSEHPWILFAPSAPLVFMVINPAAHASPTTESAPPPLSPRRPAGASGILGFPAFESTLCHGFFLSSPLLALPRFGDYAPK